MTGQRARHCAHRPTTRSRVTAALAGAALVGASLAALPPAATASAPVVVTLTDHGAMNTNCLTQELVHNIHGGGTLALWAAPDGHIKAALVDAAGLASDVANVTTDDTKVASWDTCQQVAAAPNPTGGWLVVHSTRSGTDPTPLYGRFISKDGVPAPTVLTLTSGTYLASLFEGGGHGNNQISWSSAAERYLLTWTATIPTGNPLLADAAAPKQVLGRFLDADGVGIGPDFLVTNVAATFVGPHAHARGADRWVVVATRVTGANWTDRQLGVVTITDAGTVSAPTAFGPVGLRGPDVAYNAQLDTFLVTFTEIPDPNTNALATHALDKEGAPVGSTVRVGPGPIHRARVTSIGATGYAIAYWDFPGAAPRTSVPRVDVAGRLIAGAPTEEIAGYVPSIVQQCGTAGLLLSWWSYRNPTDVSLTALDATGLTAPDCLAVSGDDEDEGGSRPSDSTSGSLSLSCEGRIATGAQVTCMVSGGEPGIDILWQAAFNPVFASAGVTLDAAGAGTFSFTIPAAALGQDVTVELVEWLAPASLGVVGGPVPASVPAGEGPTVPVGHSVFGLLAAVGAVVAVRRQAVTG